MEKREVNNIMKDIKQKKDKLKAFMKDMEERREDFKKWY